MEASSAIPCLSPFFPTAVYSLIEGAHTRQLQDFVRGCCDFHRQGRRLGCRPENRREPQTPSSLERRQCGLCSSPPPERTTSVCSTRSGVRQRVPVRPPSPSVAPTAKPALHVCACGRSCSTSRARTRRDPAPSPLSACEVVAQPCLTPSASRARSCMCRDIACSHRPCREGRGQRIASPCVSALWRSLQGLGTLLARPLDIRARPSSLKALHPYTSPFQVGGQGDARHMSATARGRTAAPSVP